MGQVAEATSKPAVTEGPAPTRPRKGPRGQVIIFGNWCKGCGLCAALCPVGVLEIDRDGRPIIIAAEKCTACHICDTHCPDLAIVVKRIEGA